MRIARMGYPFTCAAFAALVSVGSLAGCFSERVAGSDGGGNGGGNTDLCQGTPANVVQIRNFAFHPATLTVPAGTEVTWVNCDAESHTSTSDTGVWDSNLLAPRATFKRTFAAAGSFAYHCTPHPSMQASVVVN